MPRDKTGHFYYTWYPTIFQQDTQHLTLAEDGAYRRLIDHYMLTRAPLPTDDRALARIVGVTLEEWLTVKTQLVSYFKPDGMNLLHGFCDEVLFVDSARIKISRSNGHKGGRPKGSKTKRITQPVSTLEPDTNPVGLPNTTLNNTTHEEKKPPSEGKKTGTRFDLATLPNEWREFCQQERQDLHPERTFAAFRDWWIAVPGARGLKLDWFATWRNWVRRQNTPASQIIPSKTFSMKGISQ